MSRHAGSRRPRRRTTLAAVLAVLVLGPGLGIAVAAGADGDAGVVPATDPTATAPGPVATAPAPIPPVRPGTAKVVTHGPTRDREIALTFDDGACAACMAKLVWTLEQTGAHATFFPNGQNDASFAPLAERIRKLIAAGQLTIGNHTYSHLEARKVSAAAFAADLDRNERWIEQTFGVTGRPWFRPPNGHYLPSTLKLAGKRGYTKVMMWSDVVPDTKPRTIPFLLDKVRQYAKPGAILLMHGNYPNTARGLAQMLDILKAKHLKPVTLAELLHVKPQ